MRRLRQLPGFTLPSVIIASVLMMILLTAALQIAAASSHALREQYYNQLARGAAESGIVRARACAPNGLQAPWRHGRTHYLHPKSTCSGDSDSASTAHYKIISNKPRIGLRYTVGEVSRHPDAGQQTFQVTGYADILRGNGTIAKTYSFSNIGQADTLSLTSRVAMGYYSHGSGAATVVESYTTRIGEDGRVRSFGGNRFGQLGNGTLSSSAVSVPFGTIANVEKVYTNRLSAGRAIFAITADGSIYAAGDNSSGQLGSASGDTITTPHKIGLPQGWHARKVMSTQYNTFILAETLDGNSALFSLGLCHASGILGRSCDTGNKESTAGEVVLKNAAGAKVQPYINYSDDLSTQEMAADDRSAMITGKDGNMYGWGNNDRGQLGISTQVFSTQVPTPEQVTSYKSAGVNITPSSASDPPKSIATDGLSFYILQRNGRLFVSGDNTFGQLGEFAYDEVNERTLSVSQLRLSNYNTRLYCLRAEYNKDDRRFNADFDGCYTGDGTAADPNLEIVFHGSDEITLKSRSVGSPVKHGSSVGSNGLCLDASSGVTTFKSCADQSTTQRWRVESTTEGAVMLRSLGDRSQCLAAVAGNNPSSGRGGVRKCSDATGSEEKNFHFFIANPFMNELNLLNNKEVDTTGFKKTTDSVKAVSTDNRSVTFITKERPGGKYIVKSLGYNGQGMFGNRNATCTSCSRPITFILPAGETPAKVLNVAFSSTGVNNLDRYNNLYVITDTGSVYGAGSNVFGQLGSRHSLSANDTLGRNAQLMNNWRETSTSTSIMSPYPRAVNIVAGGGTAMIFADDGRVYTVGNNAVGQLGSGSTTPSHSNRVEPRPNLLPAKTSPLFY